MVYEYRKCLAPPGKLPDLHRHFEGTSLGLFAAHGIELVGLWQPQIGATVDELHYLLRYDSLRDRENRWSAFLEDERWQRAPAEPERDEPIVARIENQVWRPAPYAPAP